MRGFVQGKIHWEVLVIFSFWSGILIWRWWCASHGAEEAKFRGQADAFSLFLLPSAHPKEFLLPIRFLGLGWDYSWHSHFLTHCEVWDSRAFSTFVPLLCLSQMMQMRREATVLKWLNWILWAQRDASLVYVQMETFLLWGSNVQSLFIWYPPQVSTLKNQVTIVPSLSLWANLQPLCNVISLCTVDLVGWPLLKKASCWTHSVTSSNYGWNFSCQP